MAETIRFKYGTDEEILALTPSSPNWVNRAFYYPSDKSYFYQALDGVMKRYAGGEAFGVGAKINDSVIGAIKRYIEPTDTLNIPTYYDYNTYTLDVIGVINNYGQINIKN